MSEPFAQYPYGQYGQYPPPVPPRRHRSRTLLGLTATAVAAAGVGAGAAVALSPGSSSGHNAASTSVSGLSAAQIASRTDPGLVDVISAISGGTAEGTGIVLSASGEILTNNHVINGATSVEVTDIGNGKTYTASVTGYDESQDVAVLQLSGASGLTVASTGDSSAAAVGDDVIALGNAGGKGGTPSVAAGAITALNQSQTAFDESSGASEHLTGLIATNAGIQPGDSGGPLVNDKGQIIGMDTAALTSDQSGGSGGEGDGGYGYGGGQGGSGSGGSGAAGSSGDPTTQGFAIPINTAISLAGEIEAGGASSTVHIGATAFIGVAIDTQASGGSGTGEGGGTSEGGGLGGTVDGAEIGNVGSGSPAAEAGLSAGDVITAINGKSVTGYSDVSGDLVSEHPGDKITITYTSADGQSQTATITLATGPAA